MRIHPTAIIHPKAKLASSCHVGPYTIIGEGVCIKDGTRIGSHCVIEGNTTIGRNCQIFSNVVIGSIPQDLKYKGEKTAIFIGDNNIIREFVTINLGTKASRKTIIGNNNLIMAYSHVAHDCVIGNKTIIANCGTLAGEVKIEDGAIIGGLVGIHQFVCVGRLSIIGGCSKVVQDIPPYSTCDGHPAKVYGINVIGLKRAGIPQEVRNDLKIAFKILFHGGLSIPHAIKEIEKNLAPSSELKYLIKFVKNSKRGICR